VVKEREEGREKKGKEGSGAAVGNRFRAKPLIACVGLRSRGEVKRGKKKGEGGRERATSSESSCPLASFSLQTRNRDPYRLSEKNRRKKKKGGEKEIVKKRRRGGGRKGSTTIF